MPYPNEHSARIQNPTGFDSFKRQNNKFGRGIHAIFGIRGDKAELCAIRFSGSTFSVAQAKAWLKEHEYKPIAFTALGKEPRKGSVVQRFKSMVVSFIDGLDGISEEDRALDIWTDDLSDVQKADMEEFEEVPDEKELEYSLQRCFVGKSMYDILNLDIGAGRLMRWALLSNIQEVADIPVLTLKAAELLKGLEVEDARACLPLRGKGKVWMRHQGVQPIGSIGASVAFPGVYVLLKSGKLEYGPQTPYRHEYVLDGEHYVVQLEVAEDTSTNVVCEKALTPPLWTFKKAKIGQTEAKDGFIFKSTQVQPEFVVGGVVYPADMVDVQGDTTSKEEIWKLMKHFMLNGRKFSIEHHGRRVDLPIIESFQAEVDTVKGGEPLPAGSFWLAVSLESEPGVYKDIESGVLTGWSIEGLATAQKVGD